MTNADHDTVSKLADEKAPAVDSLHLEDFLASGLSQDDAVFLRDFPRAEHKKVFRKIDWRLMPMLMSLYLIANIDRLVHRFHNREYG
jgi:hypothetical protein